jgi:hypothetical protein
MTVYLPGNRSGVKYHIRKRVDAAPRRKHDPRMEYTTIDEVRLANLLLLMERHRAKDSTSGWERRFSESVSVNATYLPQLKARMKRIGPVVARRIESELNLPEGWMDVPHDESAPRDEAEAMFLMTMMSLYRKAPTRARVLLEQLLKEAN